MKKSLKTIWGALTITFIVAVDQYFVSEKLLVIFLK